MKIVGSCAASIIHQSMEHWIHFQPAVVLSKKIEYSKSRLNPRPPRRQSNCGEIKNNKNELNQGVCIIQIVRLSQRFLCLILLKEKPCDNYGSTINFI